MVPRKATALVIAISLLFLAMSRAPDIMAAVQTGFTLNLDNPSFSYQESSFNDSQTYQEYDFTASGDNVTYWVNVSTNSTVSTFEFNLTGKIVPSYNTTVNSATYGLLGISIGNVTGDGSNEIVTGTNNLENVLRVLNGDDGSLVWSLSIGDANNKVFDTELAI